MSRALDLLDSMLEEIDARDRELSRPRGGQHVPHFGDFAGVTPTALKRLRWWERELRQAIEEELTDPTPKHEPTHAQHEAFQHLATIRRRIEAEGMGATREHLAELLILQNEAWKKLWALAPSDYLIEDIQRFSETEDGPINRGLRDEE